MRTLALLLVALAACKDSTPSKPGPTPAPAPAAPVAPAAPPAPTHNAAPNELARGANQFALELWSKAPAGNMAISPASVSIALAIAWGGAKGTTATQLGKALRLEGSPDVVLSRWGNLAKSLAATDKPLTLKLANRLFAEKSYEIDTTYFTIVRHAFDVWIEPVEISTHTEEVRQKINGWVAEQTAQRIKNLLTPGDLSPATKLVIVNAVYFLAKWASPFEPSQTAPRSFWVDGRTEAKRPTMQQQGSFKLASNDRATLVELPYTDDAASMYIVLPTARDGLAAVEKDLRATIDALQPKITATDIVVSMPKLTLDPPTALQLAPALQALGITDAFDPTKADFTGMAHPPDPRLKLFVSSVIHKAFVKIDEEGTEAAAATAIVAKGGGPPPAPPRTLAIDHPFVFLIVDRATGLILFIGRVVDPSIAPSG